MFEPVEGETGFKTLQGQNVFKREFESIKEARDYLKKFEGVSGARIYGNNNWAYVYINDRFPDGFDYDASLVTVLNFDIECLSPNGFPKAEYAAEMITAVTMSSKGMIYAFGHKDYEPTAPNIKYVRCRDETELLHRVIDQWRVIDPDILTGWNIEKFDVPYLINRIKNQLGEDHAKRLSPWEKIREKRHEYNGNIEVSYEIAGIQQLDYMPLYRKFSFKNHESYKLSYIASVILGEDKLLTHDQIDDAWENNHQLFIEYNIDDVTKIDRFEDKLGMIAMVVANAYDSKTNYEDSFGTVLLWDTIIHNYLLSKGIVVPHGQRKPKTKSIVGGYVKEPSVGRHRYLASVDFESLYPRTISACNISPETYMGHIDMSVGRALMGGMAEDKIVDFMRENDCVLTAGGWYYTRKKKGFLGELMDIKFSERKKNKDLAAVAKKRLNDEKGSLSIEQKESLERDASRYHNKQLALKIQLNACYGALLNEWFRWFDDRLAESITMQGQLCILWMEKKVNTYMRTVFRDEDDYVIAMDTDSMYVRFDKFADMMPGADVNKLTDAIVKFTETRLEPKIAEWIKELEDYCSVYNRIWRMNRETVCDQAIWTGGKNYILSMRDEEGRRYTEPEIKIKGLGAIKSSTPSKCREALRGAFKIVLYGTNEDLYQYIKEFRKKFSELPFSQQAKISGTTDIGKYYDPINIYQKGTTAHIKGALIYNDLLEKLGLTNKYEKIKDGDKIKWTYLLKPNPINQEVIACHDQLPPELGLTEYIDSDMLFVDGFVKPLKQVTDAVGWNIEKVSTLENVF
jgi:DNA polymerase elongation subunit (family B)